MLDASIVGSLPKPVWLAPPNMLRAPWRLSGTELQEAQNDAVRLAIREQEDAGLAIVTDGELRRRHYIWGFLDGLTGIDTERLAQQRSRGGRYSETTEVARIVGAVERTRPCFSMRAASRAI
jgi:5-methyltetrahydropteroyltriglutamate--homocysteine methyltransferase